MRPSRTLVQLVLPLLLTLGACDFLNGGQNVPLQAIISVDHASGTLVAPEAVTFDSRDSRGRITNREWSIDGKVLATTPSLTHKFTTPGTYEVALTIRDAEGETDTDTMSYRIISLAQSYGADHVLTPKEFSGYSIDLEPNGLWEINGQPEWLRVEPDGANTGGPVTVTLTVNPALLPTGDPTPRATLKYFDWDDEHEIVVVALLPELVLPQKVVMPNAGLGTSSSTRFALRNTGAYDLNIKMSLAPSAVDGLYLELDTRTSTLKPTGHPSLFELTAKCPAHEVTLKGELLISTDDPRGGEHSVEYEIACRDAPAQEFQIELVFKEGDFTPKQKQMIEAAARRWEEIVVGDIPGTDTLHASGHESCLKVISDSDTIPEELKTIDYVDDLLVYVYKTTENMHANTLARGGPCHFSGLRRLPNHGMVMINPAQLGDMTNGDYLTDTVIHEIGHVLGIGTLWRTQEMIYPSVDQCRTGSTATFTFAGPLAAVEFQALGGAGDPPVDNACAHWDHATFLNESMSPVITITSDGVHSPVSVVTVASLADLGYVVDYAAADHYVLPGSHSLSAQSLGEQRRHGTPIIGIVHP